MESKKSEHQHCILNVRISLGSKFQVKLRILILWTKFTQIGYIRLKGEKVNTTIKFGILKLV